ncbi:MAG TPA: hypothetical protein VHO43_08185 [Ignavibacteriales bacterium]|nr:hypothetical protein [Ignavibacteriales bacterium]
MQPSGLVSTAYAPPFRIVMKYFITAIFAFLVLNILLVYIGDTFTGHHFQPHVLALTHIATLGWITMIIFGALFQLIPVVLQIRLFSEIMAELQFWIFTLGVFTLVYSFWFFLLGMPLLIGASLIVTSVIIFLVNTILTMFRVKEWNITATYLSAALFYLAATAVIGLLLAINLGYPFIERNHLVFLGYHANIAIAGWITMVIMGISFKLIPMFTLSHNFSIKSGKWAFGLMNAGLLGFLLELYFYDAAALYLVSAGLIVLAIAFFLFQVYVIFKKRIRKNLDAALRFSVTSYILLGITVLFGFSFLFFDYTQFRNITLAYGYLVFFGFISMLIVGQMYKILPFLTWYHKYSSKAGLEKVPMLKEMYNESLAQAEYYMMIASLAGSVVSLILDSALMVEIFFILMLLSVLIFVFNMIKIMVK